MLTFYKKYARTALDLSLLGLSVILMLWLLSILYQWVAPLFFALVWFVIIEPLAQRLHKGGLNKGLATFLSIWFWLLLLIGVFSFLGYVFVTQTEQLIRSLPGLTGDFMTQLNLFSSQFQTKLDTIDPEWATKWQGYTGTLLNTVSDWFNTFFLPLLQSLQTIPMLVINALIGLIMAYFLSLERDDWARWLRERIPESVKEGGRFLHKHVWSGLRRYMRAQLILIASSFMILWIGMSVLGVKKAFTLALICAILDLLPVVGIAVVILPWTVYSLLTGNMFLGIGLLVLYGVVLLFRQIAEPKLAGESLGISAFTMLLFLLLSFGIFGVAGLIATPVFILLLKAVFEQGVWRKWIHWPDGDEAIELKAGKEEESV